MATFQVPQFIEEKPKIVGPLTIRQFFYIAIAAVIVIIAYNIFSFFFSIIIAVVVGSVAITLAFVKVNGQEMLDVALSGLSYMWKPRIYTWQRASKEVDVSDIERIKAVRNAMSIQEKLKSITMGIATGKVFSGFSGKNDSGEHFQVLTRMTGEKVVAKKVDY